MQFVDHHRCLGVIIDNKLSFRNHIDILSGRIWGSLRKIYNAQIFLPQHVKRRLVYATLMSQITYGLEVISGTAGYLLNRIKRLVNAIVRFVYNVRRRDHISPYVKRFLGYSFDNFVLFRNLLMLHKLIKNGKPVALYNSFQLSPRLRNPHFIYPRIFKALFSKSFLVRVIGYWNSLPLELRIFTQSNNVFRLKLMKHFSHLE